MYIHIYILYVYMCVFISFSLFQTNYVIGGFFMTLFPILYIISMQDKRKLWIATTFKRRFCIQFVPKEDGKRYFYRFIYFLSNFIDIFVFDDPWFCFLFSLEIRNFHWISFVFGICFLQQDMPCLKTMIQYSFRD